MSSALSGSPLMAWHGEVLHEPRTSSQPGTCCELVLGLEWSVTDVVALIVRMDHQPSVRVGDRVVLVGYLVPSPAWAPVEGEPNPPRRVADVAGVRIRRRRWSSWWSQQSRQLQMWLRTRQLARRR